jgi:excisionase family DNA binding protein
LLGISTRSIYEHVARGDFSVRALRLGKTIRFARKAVERYLDPADEAADAGLADLLGL